MFKKILTVKNNNNCVFNNPHQTFNDLFDETNMELNFQSVTFKSMCVHCTAEMISKLKCGKNKIEKPKSVDITVIADSIENTVVLHKI